MKNLTHKLCFIALLFISLHSFCQVPSFSSMPAPSMSTIFLDFDGHTVQSGAWQGGSTFVCQPAALNATQITEIFNRVSEDYRPFNVKVTTDSTQFLNAPFDKRVRIIVTPTSAWFPNVGGVAYVGSFVWGDDTPGFVFSDKLGNFPKYIAECCTHESGHTLGLSHQSTYDANCVLTEPYSTGSGPGSDETSWAPVMGNSYGKNMTGWCNGPTPYDCTMLQDNLTILTSQNGFTYRVDDYTETLGASTTLLNASSFNLPGIITTPTDKDAFKINITQAGNIHIDVSPYSISANNTGANLDVKLMLYNSSFGLIANYNPLNTMKVVIDTSLNVGTYYLVVAGAGNNYTSNYGSLGSYVLSGFRGTLPIHDVALKASANGKTHTLSWDVIADEQIVRQVLQVSTNGNDFTTILDDATGLKSYTYVPQQKGTLFYKLKVTSIINQSMVSNIVVVKNNDAQPHNFNVSTLVNEQIKISSLDNYNYALYDANGRLITTGKNKKGTSTIKVEKLITGMYVLQMMTDQYKQTERIIKQ